MGYFLAMGLEQGEKDRCFHLVDMMGHLDGGSFFVVKMYFLYQYLDVYKLGKASFVNEALIKLIIDSGLL